MVQIPLNDNTQDGGDRTGNGLVTADALIVAERAEKYKRQLQRPEVFPTADNWRYIIDNAMAEVAPELYRKFLMSWLTPVKDRSDFHLLALENFPRYITAIDRDAALDAVYADVDTSREATLHVITECRLFDAVELLNLIDADTDPGYVALCADAYQPDYSADDIQDMQQLLRYFRRIPACGTVREKSGIFGSEKRYICRNGHSNPADTPFCTQCGLNINGFTKTQATALDHLETRIRLLQRLMSK